MKKSIKMLKFLTFYVLSFLTSFVLWVMCTKGFDIVFTVSTEEQGIILMLSLIFSLIIGLIGGFGAIDCD